MIYTSPYGDFEPATVPVHEMMLEKINEVIEEDPDKKAYILGGDPSKFVTYLQIRDQTLAVAQFLHNRGFVKQIACTVISNCLEYLPFFLGVASQGGATSGASAMFTEFELRRQFEDCKCTVVLTDEKHLSRVQKASKGLNIKTIIVVMSSAHPSGTVSWEEVISTEPEPYQPAIEVNVKEDIVALPYSSGTTGAPKGVMLTHEAYGTMMGMSAMFHELAKMLLGDSDNGYQMITIPIYHAYGLALLCMTVVAKLTSVILTGFDPDVFLRTIQDYKISVLMIVPPILVFLAKHPMCDDYDLTSVKIIGCGAAAASKSLCDEVSARFPNVERIRQGYGMTELTMGSHIADPGSLGKAGCVGKIAPGLQMKLVDPITGEHVPPGKPGEICVRGATVMKGYLGRDEATKETIKDGWLHTGDIGYCDEDGDLFIVDRLKELIKVKGLQVPPAELEGILLTHPLIDDVAVIGIPDDKSGELPKAYVVRKNSSLTEKDVADYVAERVSSYKHLKGGVEFISAIPKSEAGKILRRQLKERNVAKL